ncbi:DUF6602 domain-containing protein [Vibrio coralliilyticus]|uniref:DUF6602 domain-containing protein n=1 Tax=Vibrio coralliilyticus TaxID=190893 RepID=UPI000BAAD1B4|nr:DUF6602 domain-containing protein [Vibrio coralliilyticus]NOI60513.1 hypothetical protein [Vibrio coralliilyticus]PAT67295.1 hypothetical protein CKA27_15740 [Vibrio coralliilyticus]
MTKTIKDPVISKHFQLVSQKLLASSRMFEVADHNDIKGYGRESLAKDFLSSHLPNMIDFFTGEILDSEDNRSSQIDLILYGSHCPKLPLIDDFHLAFVDAVLAAIEVKSNLDSKQMQSCMKASERLKRLKRYEYIMGRNDTYDQYSQLKAASEIVSHLDRNGIDLKLKPELRQSNLEHTPYIVFAYKGATKETLVKNIENYARETDQVDYSFELHGPELIINLEQGFYIYKNNDWLWPRQSEVQDVPYVIWEAPKGKEGEALAGLYILLSNLSTAFLLRPPLVGIPDYFSVKESSL